jgi:hypothetical protein
MTTVAFRLKKLGIDLSTFESAEVPRDKYRAYCNRVISLYTEALKVPKAAGVPLLRYLYSR